MKALLAIVALLCFNSVSGAVDTLKLRELFYNACLTECYAEQMLDELKGVEDNADPLLVGYKGIAYMFMAKYAFFPGTKCSYFNKGKQLLETALKNNPASVELRYFRFSVQVNVPFFLNYSSGIEDDKKIIIKNVNNLGDERLINHIKNFMLSCDKCSESEKMQLR